MLKKRFMYWMRKFRLIHLLDTSYFFYNKIRFHFKNKRFRQNERHVKVPPDYLLYESYQMDYESYYNEGKSAAVWLYEQVSGYISQGNIKVLDWGCGPGRVLRHLPSLLPNSELYGSDYNIKSIEWCRKNISGVAFSINRTDPPLPYGDHFFDIAYALSVFTHLSEENHYKWFDEFYRVIKPGGILLVTTQGNVFKHKLSQKEIEEFSRGLLVVRNKAKEGHRSYSAFQPEVYMKSIFSSRWKILNFVKGTVQSWGLEQDTWVLQKT